MVDRIEKAGAEYWKIASTNETKEEKKREEKGQGGQENRDSFGETSDFTHLLAKDPRKFRSEKVPSQEIRALTFRGVSTHRERALVEVDIKFQDGTIIRGAQIAIGRQDGMRLISRKSGEELVVNQIVRGTFLTIAVPQWEEHDPAKLSPETAPHPGPLPGGEGTGKTAMSWYYWLGLGALLLALVLLFYIIWKL